MIDKGGSIVLEFVRQSVRSEIGGNNFERTFGSHRFEHANLMLQVQPVAALGLDRRSSVFQESISEPNMEQLRRTDGFDARQNSSASREDFHVRHAFDPPFEFFRARADEYSMRMRIDESGEHHLLRSVEFMRASVGQLIRRSDPFDNSIANGYRTIINNSQLAELKIAAWSRGSCEC